MRLARFVLVASAFPLAAIGIAFLVAPFEMGARVGIALVNATAEGDARAVYGGLQLACAALLLVAARGDAASVRAGVIAQLALYGGLAGARFVSLAFAGAPSALGFALHGAELAALAAGGLAWRSLGRAGARSASRVELPAPPGFAIERADPSRLGELLELVDDFQREAGYAPGDAALRACLAELLADQSLGVVLILRESGAAIGYAALCLGFSLEFRGRDAFVDEIYLAPARRGRGLGRALLRALESEARMLGVRQLHLEVESENDGARRLYLSEGFLTTGRELLSKRLV